MMIVPMMIGSRGHFPRPNGVNIVVTSPSRLPPSPSNGDWKITNSVLMGRIMLIISCLECTV